MRLFIGVDCSELKSELTELQKLFYSLKARFTQSFHLTLHFIGETDKHELESIIQRLQNIKAEGFTLSLNSLGTFTSYSQKVIWCGVKESKALMELQRRVRAAILNDNSEIDAFHPHITLARIKKHQILKEVERKLLDRELKKEFASRLLQVNRFVLYQSELTKQGPVYTEVKEYPLGIWRDA